MKILDTVTPSSKPGAFAALPEERFDLEAELAKLAQALSTVMTNTEQLLEKRAEDQFAINALRSDQGQQALKEAIQAYQRYVEELKKQEDDESSGKTWSIIGAVACCLICIAFAPPPLAAFTLALTIAQLTGGLDKGKDLLATQIESLGISPENANLIVTATVIAITLLASKGAGASGSTTALAATTAASSMSLPKDLAQAVVGALPTFGISLDEEQKKKLTLILTAVFTLIMLLMSLKAGSKSVGGLGFMRYLPTYTRGAFLLGSGLSIAALTAQSYYHDQLAQALDETEETQRNIGKQNAQSTLTTGVTDAQNTMYSELIAAINKVLEQTGKGRQSAGEGLSQITQEAMRLFSN